MTIALTLALAVSVPAYQSGDDKNVTLTGRYSFVSMESKGERVDAEAAAEQGMDTSSIYLEFSGGGVTMYAFGEIMEVTTYKVDGTNIEFYVDEVALKGTLQGNQIIIEFDEGEVLVVEKKQDSNLP